MPGDSRMGARAQSNRRGRRRLGPRPPRLQLRSAAGRGGRAPRRSRAARRCPRPAVRTPARCRPRCPGRASARCPRAGPRRRTRCSGCRRPGPPRGSSRLAGDRLRRRKAQGRTPVRSASAATAVARELVGSRPYARRCALRSGLPFRSHPGGSAPPGQPCAGAPRHGQGFWVHRAGRGRERAENTAGRATSARSGGREPGACGARRCRPQSIRPAGPVEALAELLDELAVEPVVPAQGDLAGQPALARPAGHRVGRHAQQLRNLRPGQELGSNVSGARRRLWLSRHADVLDRFVAEKWIRCF